MHFASKFILGVGGNTYGLDSAVQLATGNLLLVSDVYYTVVMNRKMKQIE